MIIIGDILIPSVKCPSHDYYSWIYSLYRAGASFYNVEKVLSKYAKEILNRDLASSFTEDYFNMFGSISILGSSLHFDKIYDYLISIA